MRIKTVRRRNHVVAAETGCCCRCQNVIYPGQRVTNEAGKFPAHHDCIRLGIVVPKNRDGQSSAGWGSVCASCGEMIERPQPWSRTRTQVFHTACYRE